MDGGAVELIVKAVLTDRASLHLELVWNVVDFIPHKSVVLKIRVVFSKAIDQLAKLHEVERGVFKRLEFIG